MTLPAGENHIGSVDFYSHAPYGTWRVKVFLSSSRNHFYSHAPYGTWHILLSQTLLQSYFYSHAPYGTWRSSTGITRLSIIFLLTRPLRDVTPDEPKPDEPKPISTHTPLTGRDCFWGGRFSKRFHFYSHAPYGTWPISPIQNTIANGNFYSHAPYGTWLELLKVFYLNLAFLLTRPLRDVTSASIASKISSLISTHTPLTGRDFLHHRCFVPDKNFYSHAPYGTWRIFFRVLESRPIFLLTRPLRDVTSLSRQSGINFEISTHTPLTGRDISSSLIFSIALKFLLTRPLRDVTSSSFHALFNNAFLLTRPLRDVTPLFKFNSIFSIFLLTRPLRDVTLS